MGAVFTFSLDDGHPLDVKVADLLGKHCLHGTFYVPIYNSEGRPTLKKEALRSIARSFEIGSHTIDHRYLSSVDAVEARRQVEQGKTQLEDMLGQAVAGFCYPGGKYRRLHQLLVQRAGFTYARTTMNLCFDAGHRPFELPTTIQFYPHSAAVYWRNFALAGNWGARHAGLRLAVRHQGWIERMYALFDHVCLHGGTFHMWAHSYEIEQLGGWSELDRFFRHVAIRVPPLSRLTNHQVMLQQARK